MLLFTTREKLELQSVRGQKSSQIVFRDKILTRGPDFARKLWQKAKQYCESYYNSDILCVLVDHSSYVSIWKEYDRNPEIASKQEQTGATETDRSVEIELTPELISRYQQELAEYIGPIAALVCEQALAENPNLEIKEFIKTISDRVPDRDRAEELEKRLLSSLKSN
ncbi:MAG: hypothetical protein ACFBSE_07480 [Prochloraceae cyanobacterium]